MKVLQFLTHLDIGGITTYVYTLSKYLKKEGVEVAVASSGGAKERDFLELDIPVFRLNIRTKNEFSPKVFLATAELLSIRKRFGFDIIHSHTRVTHVAAQFFSFLVGIPHVANFHGFYRQHYRRRARKIFRAQGDVAVAITPYVKEDLVKFFRANPDKVRVILSAIDIEGLENRVSPPLNLKGYPRIGASGRLSSVKGFNLLIKSMPGILRRFPEAHLYILGEGKEEEALLALADNAGVGRAFTILKQVSLSSFLSSLDVFCLPSLEEPLGLSVLEAQYFGVPCVVSDTGGLRILVNDGNTGLRIPVGDVKGITDAVISLMEDENLKRHISRKSKEQVRNKFDFSEKVKEFINVYKEVLNG